VNRVGSDTWSPKRRGKKNSLPEGLKMHPKKTTTATIGQYADFPCPSDFCACGQRATKVLLDCGMRIANFCSACSFRHTVMKAAGREQEFWDARKEMQNFVGGEWVSYNVKFTAVSPGTTMRLRNIKAGTEDV
jgi:hypothetical protein